MYACKTWSLNQTEKNRLGMSENRVLKRISGPMGTNRRQKKLNEELHNLYSSQNTVRMIK
jgi:hypothetical protein